MIQKYAMLLQYDGTDYCGWQKQRGSAAAGAPSIQETIEKTIRKITGEDRSIVGSGRTDAGVHAVGQVAHFVLDQKKWDPSLLRKGLNSQLPKSIRVRSVTPVGVDFDASRSVIKKQYSYYFIQGPCAFTFSDRYAWWCQKELDLLAMQRAVTSLVGRHDFVAFCAAGSAAKTTVRTIFEAEVTETGWPFPCIDFFDQKLIRLRVVGSGFLKQMVRGIAGTLRQIGEKKRDVTSFSDLLAHKNRAKTGPTAAARGLWLERVWYASLQSVDWL